MRDHWSQTSSPASDLRAFLFRRPTASVTRKWAGVEKDWKWEQLEAGKELEKRADSHLSGARIVGRRLTLAGGMT